MQADIFLSNSANALLCEKLIKANSSRRCRSGHRDGVALALALPLTLLTNLIRDCKAVSISEPGEWDHTCCCFRITAVYMINSLIRLDYKESSAIQKLKRVKGWAPFFANL